MGFSWAYIDCGTNLVQGPGGETGSIQFRDGDFTITGSPRLVWDTGTADPADIHNLHVSGNVHVSGTIFAYSYNVNETIRSTTHLNISGASQFGDSFDDVHQFTGSLRVSGAFQDGAHNVNGMALFVTANADMGLVGINTNPTTSPNNRHAKAALTVVAKGATFDTLDSAPVQLRLSGSGLSSSFDFVVDDDKVMTILPSVGDGHITISSSGDGNAILSVKSNKTDPIFEVHQGAGPDMAAVSIGYPSSSTQGLRVSGAVSSSLGLNIKGTAEFSHPTSIETTGSVIVKHIISCSADLSNNINTNLGGAVQFTNTGTSIQASGAISASKGIVVGGLGIFTLGDGVSDAIHASGNVIVGGILSGSELGNTGKGGQFLGTQYFTKEGTSIETSGAISSSGGVTVGGELILAGPVNFVSGAIITKALISSSAPLNIGGTSIFSNPESLLLSGTLISKGLISSSAGPTMGGTGIFSHPDTSLLLSGTLSSSGGATFLGDMFVNDSNVSGTLTVGTSTVIITSTNISATAGMTLGGAAVFTNNQNANPNSIITSGSISSSLGSLIIGGGTTLSNTVNISGTTTTAGTISSSAGAVFLGTVIADTIQASSSIMSAGALTISGAISSSGEGGFHRLRSQAGTYFTGSMVNHGDITITNGAVSSSGGATFLDGVIAKTIEASSSIMAAGNLTVTGTISSSAEGGFHSLKSQAGATITGSTTLHGAVSSSYGGTYLGGIIAKTIEASSSIMAAGNLTVTGTISGSGEGAFHSLKSQAGATITGSTTLHGAVSSSFGGTYLGGIIATTLEASSSIMSAGNLTVSGTISGSGEGAFHSLKSQAGTTLTGSLVNHGALTVTNGTISSSGPMVIGGIAVFSNAGGTTAPSLSISGTVLSAGQISSSAGAIFADTVVLTKGGTTIQSSGSTILGNLPQRVHQITGTLNVSGAGVTAPALYATGTNGGKVGIKTNSPTSTLSVSGNIAVSSSTNTTYINFTETDGSDGIGVRVSAGTMQFKNVGGSWTAMGTGGGGVGLSDDNAWTGKNAFSGSGFQVLPTAHFTNAATAIESSGTISSSAGAVFLGTVIANTIQASSSIMSAGSLTITGTISGSGEGAFHSLKSQAGATLTGSLINHGSVSITSDLSGSGKLSIGGPAVFSSAIASTPTISTSGSVGIKTSSPTSLLSVSGNIGLSASANTTYVNFTETDGSDGIGIRVSAGTMQFKNVGGSWAAISSGGSGTSESDDVAWTGKHAFSGSAVKVLPTAHFTNTGTSIQVSGNILPGTDNSSDLGSAAKRWANLYTGDLHLKNDRGDWTIIEEEDYLSLRNNKTGKLFKFVLQEIE